MRKLCPDCERPLVPGCTIPDCVCTDAKCSCGFQGQFTLGLTEPRLPPTPPKMPYISIDIETSGLNPETCQTLEIGAVIDDWQTPIQNLPTFRRVLVHKQIIGTPFALALNAGLLKQIDNPQMACLPEQDGCCEPEKLGEHFSAWIKANHIDPLHLQAAGKNFASFDLQFLKRLPNFNAYVNFRHRVLDPAVLFYLPTDDRLPDSKTCYERAGLDAKVAHTAVEDARAVVWLVRAGIKRLAMK